MSEGYAMGWRFRKTRTLFPGVRVNIGSRGVTSMSVGGRVGRLNLSKRGLTGTVSAPGTGLSYSQRLISPASASRPPSRAPAAVQLQPPALGRRPGLSWRGWVAVLIVGLMAYVALRLSSQPVQDAPTPRAAGPVVLAPQPPSAVPALTPVQPVAVQPSSTVATAVTPGGQTQPGPPEATAVWMTATQAANVRSAASMSGTVVHTVAPGTRLRVLRSDANWRQVSLSGEAPPIGWIHSSLLSPAM